MKHFLLLFFIPLFGISQNSKAEENGFENYKFGTSPSEYKNLILEVDDGATKLYSTTYPLIKIDGVECENVNITFNTNKLSTIAFNTKNSTGAKLLQTLKERYGEPQKINVTEGNYEWASAKTQILYETKPGTQDAIISLYGKDVFKTAAKTNFLF